MEYIVIDIEVCPVKLEGYPELTETEKKKLLNPIDSCVVAIGLRYNSKNIIIQSSDEKKMLTEFWAELKSFLKGNSQRKITGFNIKDFDLPFLVTRSFIRNIEIHPFILKGVVDLRDQLSAFRYGPVRGKLKEFGEFLGIELHEMDGSQVAEECLRGNFPKIKEYLAKDLEITEKILERAISTKIIDIKRW